MIVTHKGSHYNADLALKEASDIHGRSLRVIDSRSLADQHYTHFRADYNLENAPTQVIYYRGTNNHITRVTPTSSTSLNNKYFTIFTAPDQKQHTIWFNIAGAGTQPIVPNTHQYTEIAMISLEPALIVAVTLELTINSTLGAHFTVERSGTGLTITPTSLGETTNSSAGTSGFSITNTPGAQDVVADIEIEYNANKNPIYKGQELRGMIFNLFSGKYENKQASISSVADYEFQDMSDSGTGIIYVGSKSKSGNYLIKKITEIGTDVEVRFANISNNAGNATYASAWTNRATLAYTYSSDLSQL